MEQPLQQREAEKKYDAIAVPAALESFPDIDECLEARAKAVIELAGAISLKQTADKTEERERQSREALEARSAIAVGTALAKR